jgi:hypothetical protein
VRDVEPMLAEMGFRVVRRGASEVIAIRRKWHWDCVATRLTAVVAVREVETLDAAGIEADRARLDREAGDLDRGSLPRGFQKGVAVLALYFARRVDPTARAVLTRRPPRRWAYFQVPAAFDGETGSVLVVEKTPLWGAVYFSKFRHIARRVLDPESEPAREPLSAIGVALWVVLLLLVLMPLVQALLRR